MSLPEPLPKNFTTLVDEISKGQIKIPQFQRDFVWGIQKSANLLDSIIKGYPIGTFIFWRTKEQLRTVRNVGNLSLPQQRRGEFVDFVLDGQQRLTSIYASLKGAKVEKDGKVVDYSEMYVDLDANKDEKIVIFDISDKRKESIIKITDLLTGGLTLLTAYPRKYHTKIERYKNIMNSTHFSTIQVKDVPIDIATEIFTRINTGGVPLSVFEIMVAKTFDVTKQFDLAEKYANLIERLGILNYDTVPESTVLQVVSVMIKKECKKKVILKLNKNRFISEWDKAVDAIERAVEYFRSYYRIPVSQLLPYKALIVPFAYFFYHHPDKPTGEKRRFLQDFFWRCALSGRYSSSVESKLAQDVKRIDKILREKLPEYDWYVDTSPRFIMDNGWFSASRSYVKSILCILASQEPKSFNDNSSVNISNDWLKRANSKNYHHFFPRAYLKKQGRDESEINHILNITIVDDYINKREIGAKPPSVYMKKFREENHRLKETMNTHLITDLRAFGIWTDNYDSFREERAKVISKELRKRIIKQKREIGIQPKLIDDYEAEEMD